MFKIIEYQDTVPNGYEFLFMASDNTMAVLESPGAVDRNYMKHHDLCPFDGQYITSCLYCITLNQNSQRSKKLAKKLIKNGGKVSH